MSPARTAHGEFRVNDLVRLLHQHGAVRAGTLGRILGHFATEIPTYVVSFEGNSVRIVGDVLSGDLVLAVRLSA